MSIKTAFMLCDVQEGFRKIAKHQNTVIHVSLRMLKAAEILNIPYIVTEQNPTKLGKTVEELSSRFEKSTLVHVLPKMTFSMWSPQIEELFEKQNINEVALFGVETHVCILQTVLSLLKNNIKVNLLVDGITSRHVFEKEIALRRLQKEGAVLTSSESYLFEMLGTATHEKFKEISNLIKSTDADVFKEMEGLE